MFTKELRIVLTEDCNYNCYFCHKEGMKQYERMKLDKDDYKFLFEFCKENFGWNEVTLTGGEPFIRNDIDDIIKGIYDSKGKITVVTNGILAKKHFESLQYLERLNISMHVLDCAKYDEITQSKGNFKELLMNISNIRNTYPDLDIRLNVVLMKEINDTIEKLNEYILFAKKIKASIKLVELFTDEKEKITSIDDVANDLKLLGFKYKDMTNISKQVLTDGEVEIILSRIFCANANLQLNPESYCNKYNDIFITPEGKINICRKSKEDIDILDAIKNRDLEELRIKLNRALECLGKNCPILSEEKKLAINGGIPIFKDIKEAKFIHPIITKEIEESLISQLHEDISIYDNSGILGKFETEFSKYHNRKHGLSFSSGTAALWGMYEGIGLKKDDEVICPNYTFFATVTPIFFTGAKPVLIDCLEDGNIDFEKVKEKINNKTKAIMVTHMWGYPCKMDKLREIADEYGIFLLEDCSHAHGGSYKGIKLGAWSDASVFSLQGQKIITGGEGGILLTDDSKIKERALLLGHYNKRCKVEIDKNSELYKFYITGKGMKLRAHPLAIRLAYEQFKKIDQINEKKNEFAKLIIKELDNINGLKVLKPGIDSINSWYAIIFKYNKEKMFGISRERFVEALKKEGAIEVDIPNSTCPLNRLEIFKFTSEVFPEYENKEIVKSEAFYNSDDFYESIIKLPVWYREEDRDKVIKYIRAIKKVCNNIKELI